MNIYDIARKAGVSTATVSRVINGSGSVSEKTRKKVSKIMSESGYAPNVFARGLMVNSMKTIGVLTIDVRDLYYARSIHAIETEARRSGYNVILCSTGEDIPEKKKYLRLLLQKRVDGIILIGSVFKEKSDNRHIVEAAEKVPLMMINGYMEGTNIYSIMCDDKAAVESAVKYLADLGHKDVVYLYDVETFSGMEKLSGFQSAAMEYRLNADKGMIIRTGRGIEGGYHAVQRLIKEKNPFKAILASEDILAAGALKALIDAGINVPDGVSVIGYNNSVISQCTMPEMTSIDNKVDTVSINAASLLIDAITGGTIPRRTIITSELVERKSVKKL